MQTIFLGHVTNDSDNFINYMYILKKLKEKIVDFKKC